MNVFEMILLAVRYGPTVKAALDEAASNDSVLVKISRIAPVVGPLLTRLGAQLFPKAAPAIQQVGAAVAAFDPNGVKWLQGALNAVQGTKLVVDGIYGPKTTAAVEDFQKQHGLVLDGVAGKITQAALQALLTAMGK